MEQSENLLKTITLLVEKEKNEREERVHRGELFNIFKVCGIDHYELQHSAIISELLNPHGSHGQEGLYLKLFMQVYASKLSIDEIEYNRISVQREKWTEAYDGRMDICIEYDRLPFIILENKLYAKDQSIQLRKYKNEAERIINKSKNPKQKYEIVYLTLDGHEATKDSSEGVDYIRMSYKKDIIRWLDLCIENSVRLPLLRETLIQYQNHIKIITNNDMSEFEKQNLYKMLAKYPEATRKILSINTDDYWWFIYNNHIKNKLKEIADKYSLQFDDSEMIPGGNCSFSFYKKSWKENIKDNTICITFETDKKNYTGYYVGITSSQRCSLKKQDKALKCFGSSQTSDIWPLGWKYLDDEFSDWSANGKTIVTMANGEFAKYIDNIIKEIIEDIEKNEIDISHLF